MVNPILYSSVAESYVPIIDIFRFKFDFTLSLYFIFIFERCSDIEGITRQVLMPMSAMRVRRFRGPKGCTQVMQ